MSEPWKEVAAAQDAMAGDSDNEMEGMITAAQNTMEEDQTKVKLDAKELVTEAYALMSSTIKRLKTIVTATKKYTDDLRGLNED